MNKLLPLIIVFLLATEFLKAQYPTHVNSQKFSELINSEEGVLLDVRTAQEYSRGHIEGSTLISTNDRSFVNKVSLLQKDKPIYIYCLTGSRSKMVANYLSQNGYTKIYNLARGILEWQQYGYPIVQSTSVVASASKTYTEQDFANLIKTNNVVLVDFHAPWCAPCKKLSPIIDQVKKDYQGKAKIEKVDIEANKSLKNAYQIQSIPGLLLFKNGKQVWKHTGPISYDDLKAKINQHL